MIDLLMLGIVPGTNIQINFGDWLLGSAMLTMLVVAIIAVRYGATMVLMRHQQHVPIELSDDLAS